MRASVIQRLQEIYRSSQYRATKSGGRVQWDEPGEDDTTEVRRHNAFLAKKLQQKRDAKKRLKSKGAVPTRDGKPIFEEPEVVTEDVSKILMSFRRLYQSNRSMRFKDWMKVVAELLDALA